MTKLKLLLLLLYIVLEFWNMVFGRTILELLSSSSSQFSKTRLQEMESIVSCAYNVSTTYLAGRSLIFISEQLDTDLSESLIRKMKDEMKIIYSASAVSQNTGSGFLFFFHDGIDITYVDLLEKITPNDVMRFVVIMDFQEKIYLKQIQKILEEFWLYQIIDVIVIVPYRISKNIRVYTYYPFSPIRCGETGPPVLINVWNSHDKMFLNKNDLFSRTKKIFNLHGCPLKCMGIHRPPESTITLLPDNTWQLSGTGNKVFKFIRSYMNFTSKISILQKLEQNKNTFQDENITIPTARFDIAFGKFIRILDSELSADFTSENVMDCFTWAVPHGIGRQPSIWTKYSIEFSLVIWFLILLNFFVTSIVIRWMVSRLHIEHSDWSNYDYILFYTFSTFIGANLKLKPPSTPLRLFTIQWLLYSLVITSAYQAYMGSLMTIPRAEPEINKQTDLLNTNLNLVGRREMFHVLNESATNSIEFRNIIGRFFILPPTDFDTIIKRLIEQRDIAIFTSRRELIYYAQKRRNNLDKARDIHIFSDCVIKSYSSSFMLKKGSPFRHPIHQILTTLFETGIYNNWDNDNILDEIYHDVIFSKDTVLVLNELYGAFVVLLSGLTLSIVIFFLELYIKMIRDKQKSNLQYDTNLYLFLCK